jgi:hypothetical protein
LKQNVCFEKVLVGWGRLWPSSPCLS